MTLGNTTALLSTTRACVVAFVVITAIFHIVRSDIDPLARGISRYQWGPYGTVMSIGFVLLATACACMATLSYSRYRLASTLWSASAMGGLLVAFVPLSDTPTLLPTVAHQLGGFVLFTASAVAMNMVPARVIGRGMHALARLSVALLITFFATIVILTSWRGLLQRTVVLTLCVWMLAAAHRVARPLIEPEQASL